MIVIIDYNYESISLQNDESEPRVLVFTKMRRLKMLESLMEEMFNMLNLATPGINVTLKSISDDEETIVGEW